MTFQALDLKSRHFLDLVNSENNILEPSYNRSSTWFKYFGHSNILCTKAARAITNHGLISKYQLCFFLREEFSYPCRLYPIEIRHYILYECRRFNSLFCFVFGTKSECICISNLHFLISFVYIT